MIVYVDVLVVVNFIVNYFLLLGASSVSGRAINRIKIIFAAFLGSLSALIIFLPMLGPVENILYKLAVASIMIFIAFDYINLREYLKQIFGFFAVTFIFGGAMLGLNLWFSPQNMIYYNGVVYFDISAVFLICTTTIVYVLVLLFGRIFKAHNPSEEMYTVVIESIDHMVTLKGFMDTGNHLKEPFSDTPVILGGYESLKSILPLQVIRYINNGAIASEADAGNMRMIPYKAVGEIGLLPAFKPYKLYLVQGEKKYKVEDIYIAVTKEKVGDARYDILLNSDLLKIKL